MRFCAAALVVYSHSFALLAAYGREPFVRWSGHFSGGQLGVAIFFVMSGYLVTASRENSPDTLQFLWKRALRIFPALAVVVLLTVFVLGPALTTLPVDAYFRHQQTREYLWNMLLWVHFPLPGLFAGLPHPGSVNGSLWTLPIEAAMYAGVALLGMLGLLKRSWMPGLVVLLVCAFAYVDMHPELHQLPISRIGPVRETLRFALFFFCGATLYLFERRIPWHAGIAALLIAAWIVAVETHSPLRVYCMFAAVSYGTLYVARRASPLLANFGRYGDFSYGIYIYSFPIQQTLVQLSGAAIAPLSLFALSLPLALACAFGSWHLIEKPALGLKQRLGPRPDLTVTAREP